MADLENVIKRLRKVSYYFKSLLAVGWQGDADIYREHMESVNMAIAMLKEQKPKTGHWIFESRYCDAWSNICSECGRLMTTGEGVYANYCSNCGAKMTGGEV